MTATGMIRGGEFVRSSISRRPAELQALDRRLDEAARQAAAVIKSHADPLFATTRFLILIADSLQTRRPPPPTRRVSA